MEVAEIAMEKDPVAGPVKDAEKTIIRDSIVYRDRYKEIPVPADLTKWQKFSIWAGRLALLALITWVGWKIWGLTRKIRNR